MSFRPQGLLTPPIAPRHQASPDPMRNPTATKFAQVSTKNSSAKPAAPASPEQATNTGDDAHKPVPPSCSFRYGVLSPGHYGVPSCSFRHGVPSPGHPPLCGTRPLSDSVRPGLRSSAGPLPVPPLRSFPVDSGTQGCRGDQKREWRGGAGGAPSARTAAKRSPQSWGVR